MNHEVSRCIDLSGHDEQDLEERLLVLREAVRARRGVVTRIDWSARGRDALQHATVFYKLVVLDEAAAGAR